MLDTALGQADTVDDIAPVDLKWFHALFGSDEANIVAKGGALVATVNDELLDAKPAAVERGGAHAPVEVAHHHEESRLAADHEIQAMGGREYVILGYYGAAAVVPVLDSASSRTRDERLQRYRPRRVAPLGRIAGG